MDETEMQKDLEKVEEVFEEMLEQLAVAAKTQSRAKLFAIACAGLELRKVLTGDDALSTACAALAITDALIAKREAAERVVEA